MSDRETLETRVSEVMLGFLHQRRAFTPLDVAEALESELGAIPIARIAKAVRRWFDQGLLRQFGYRRTLSQRHTAQGVITAVLYSPPLSKVDRRAASAAPTRAPAARRYGYLDLALSDVRRLERQTEAIKRKVDSAAGDLIRLGEMLSAVRAMVGPAGLRRYVEQELQMSADTALRWIRVAEVFGGHPSLERLSVLRPASLYQLAQASFPADLREKILRLGGLMVDGELRPLASLRARDLADAKAAYYGLIEKLEE